MIALPIRRWPTRATGASLAPGLVRSTNDLACGGRYPDRTLLLALDPDVARNRVEGRSTDGRATAWSRPARRFARAYVGGFEAIAASEPGRVHVIDADGSVDEVHGRICSDLADLLDLNLRDQTKSPRRHVSCSVDSGVEERS